MTASTLALLTAAIAVLWVVPSIGTQGMGTIGARVTHVDAALFDTEPAARTEMRVRLAQADRAVEAALGQ